MTVYALRLENNTDTAARVRMADLLGLAPGTSPLTARTGLRPDGGGAVTVQAGTMNVQVAPFAAWVQGGVSTVQGGYPFVSDSAVTLAITAGHATLSRTDVIAGVVRDNPFDGSGLLRAELVVVPGTPGQGVPALPTNAVPLREVTVPAGLSAGNGGLQNANLGTDRRRYLAAAGGIVPVSSQAERDQMGARAGQPVYRSDLDSLEFKTSAGWRALGVREFVQLTCTQQVGTATGQGLAIPGLSYTFTSPGTDAVWAVDVSLDVERYYTNTAGAVFVGLLRVDSVANASQMVLNCAQGFRTPVCKRYLLTNLAAGQHTVDARSATTGGNDYVVNSQHATMTITRLV